MNADEREIFDIFTTEATRDFETWEKTCLLLEKSPSTETIQLLFRTAHNLKGSSASVGLTALASFIHEAEEIITLIKIEKLKPTQDVIDLLLEAQQIGSDWVENLKTNPAYEPDIGDFSKKIGTFLEPDGLNRSTNQKHESKTETNLFEELGDIFFDEQILKQYQETSLEKKESKDKTSPEIQNTHKPFTQKLNQTREPKSITEYKSEETIRINLSKLDSLINLVGELVVNQNMTDRHQIEGTLLCNLSLTTLAQTSKIIDELQSLSMSFRMLPLNVQFQKMNRIIRDVSKQQNKEVEFQSHGGDVELDKVIVEHLADPLTHLIRNAIDHGIENTEERLKSGKPIQSKITLTAVQKDAEVDIIIQDDGKGMNPQLLIKKALEKGILLPEQKLTDSEAFALIFEPGFSTKEAVTSISGRGVGMDVVRRTVEDMKGKIQIKTELGKGTTFTITLPLSLSILKGLVVNVGSRNFVVPTSQLIEIVDYKKHRMESISGKGKMLSLRGEVLSVHSLYKIMHPHAPGKSDQQAQLHGIGLVMMHMGKKILLQIEEIIREETVVLKKLSNEIENLPGIIAGAVLSNGEPALVLNLNNTFDHWKKHAA